MPRISQAHEIEQRRMAVLELVSKGYNQAQEADKLNYSKAWISNDIRIIMGVATILLSQRHNQRKSGGRLDLLEQEGTW